MDIGEKSYELEYVLEKNDTGNDVSFNFRIWRLVLWDVLRFLHLDLLGVLRTLGFYINFRQLAINGHSPRYVRGARWGKELRAEHAAFILINGPLAVINVKNKRGTRKRKLHVETDLRYL